MAYHVFFYHHLSVYWKNILLKNVECHFKKVGGGGVGSCKSNFGLLCSIYLWCIYVKQNVCVIIWIGVSVYIYIYIITRQTCYCSLVTLVTPINEGSARSVVLSHSIRPYNALMAYSVLFTLSSHHAHLYCIFSLMTGFWVLYRHNI